MRNGGILIITLILLFSGASAQDITGLWKGTLYNDTTRTFYKYEIGISNEKGKLTGFSHTWFILDDKQYFGVKKVKIKRSGDKLIIEDDGLIANNYPVVPPKNVRQLNVLTLEIVDSVMYLKGPFSTNRTREYHSLTGFVELKRRNDFWQSALVPHLQELSLHNSLSFVREEQEALTQAEQTLVITRANTNDPVKTEIAAGNVSAKLNQPAIPTEAKELPPLEEAVLNSQVKTAQTVPVKRTGTDPKVVAPNSARPVVPGELQMLEEEEARILAGGVKRADIVTAPRSSETRIIEPPASAGKVNNPLFYRDPNLPAAEVDERNTIIQHTVFFTSDSLHIALYDNGEVDGDTVSVLMNGQVLLAKERLSTNAVRKSIYLQPGQDSIRFTMYAENLGAIAPNTGLLVVKDGKETYEVRFSGDLQRNAAIIFRRKQK